MERTVRVHDRYRGFPGLAMGGVSGGLLARHLGAEAEVAFRRPIPTGEPLEVATAEDAVELRLDGEVAAVATRTAVDVDFPEPVSPAAAAAATRSYRGHREHPYPECFSCGPGRDAGDGLRVFPGPVDDGPGPAGEGSRVAAAWTPHPALGGADGSLPVEYVWAAVDCASIWPLVEATPADSPHHVVSGRLAVRVDGPVRAGEPNVVEAWPLASRTERRLAAAVVRDGAGEVRAVARHTLVVTDWGVPLGVAGWGGRE